LRHNGMRAGGARIADHAEHVTRLKPPARLGQVRPDATALFAETMATQAGEFVPEQKQGFLHGEGGARLRLILGLAGHRPLLLRPQKRAENAHFIGSKTKVRHARAIARLTAEWPDGCGTNEESRQPVRVD